MAERTRFALAAGGGVLAASALLAADTILGTDYARPGRGVDAAGPQIDALVHLDLHRFFAEQSFLGPVSLLLRAPFAALSQLGDGGVLAQYRLGSFPCLVALGLAATVVALVALRRGVLWWHAALLVALLVLGPPVVGSLRAGHPEEPLTAALVLGAAVSAALGRPRLAVSMIGLAIACKPWAVLALGPVAVAAAPSARLRVAATGAALGILLIAPFAVADTSAFRTAVRAANATDRVRPLDLWWPLSAKPAVTPGGAHVTLRRLSPAVRHGVRPALAVFAALLALLVARRGRATLGTVLVLLAFVFLLRCLLDPGDNPYYHVPFVAALGAWEVVARRRPPVLALVAGVLLSQRFISRLAPDNDLISAVYLAWALPLTAYLALALRRA